MTGVLIYKIRSQTHSQMKNHVKTVIYKPRREVLEEISLAGTTFSNF